MKSIPLLCWCKHLLPSTLHPFVDSWNFCRTTQRIPSIKHPGSLSWIYVRQHVDVSTVMKNMSWKYSLNIITYFNRLRTDCTRNSVAQKYLALIFRSKYLSIWYIDPKIPLTSNNKISYCKHILGLFRNFAQKHVSVRWFLNAYKKTCIIHTVNTGHMATHTCRKLIVSNMRQ